MPYRVPVTLVFGKPLKFSQINKPSEEDIDQAHAKYCCALLSLFDEHKVKLGYDSAKLEIF